MTKTPGPDDVVLVEPRVDLRDAFLDMAWETHAAGEGRYDSALQDFDVFVERLCLNDRGEGLPRGFVPMTSYWLLRDDGRLVGSCSLRHRLAPHLMIEGGHIGYAIRPTERRRGYGRRQLALALDRARSRGLERVLVTCDEDNVGSIRVIEQNGGAYEGTDRSPRTGNPVRRYWIELVGSGR